MVTKRVILCNYIVNCYILEKLVHVLYKIENLIKLERKIVAGQINGNSNVHDPVRVNSYQKLGLIPTIYQHIDCF